MGKVLFANEYHNRKFIGCESHEAIRWWMPLPILFDRDKEKSN